MTELELENQDICKSCGGVCCKKSGCDYWVTDFENLSYQYLYNKLMEGNISITSIVRTEILPNKNLFINLLLYLRARNTNRPIVDLLSMKTSCSMLKEDGCSYDRKKRPSGGLNLIPKENFECYPLKDHVQEMLKWERYQKTLHRLVKRISGYSVDVRFKMDVEKFFLEVLNENYEGVSPIEKMDISTLIPVLISAFPNEYEKAKQLYCKQHVYVKNFK